ncbi:MAG: hypothetical protein IT376_08095 [Polyangiaceae bacterium]|nr:hypothetical protein [Polyangiaceae bacterium]
MIELAVAGAAAGAAALWWAWRAWAGRGARPRPPSAALGPPAPAQVRAARRAIVVGDRFTCEGLERWVEQVWELHEGDALVATIGWAAPFALILPARAAPLRWAGRTVPLTLGDDAPPRLELAGRHLDLLRRLPVEAVAEEGTGDPPAPSGLWFEYQAGAEHLFAYAARQATVAVLGEPASDVDGVAGGP